MGASIHRLVKLGREVFERGSGVPGGIGDRCDALKSLLTTALDVECARERVANMKCDATRTDGVSLAGWGRLGWRTHAGKPLLHR